ncbi:AsnC family transcriptional regulator [Halorarum halobium]|uniref:AsnC family transcriptional regulator n=1 Tax=Halorarum halobium TaxID=3075121 RepID=UPI0028AA08E0|nr:AsnC family transcriptional regulator [Halobaculum sp. XH14]
MSSLDETDVRILERLAENAREPFARIGEAVDLSGPAVSDRVQRLQEAGIIRQFTVDVDRGQLRAGVPVLVELTVEPGALDETVDRLRGAEAVEHVFETADGTVLAHARLERGKVREWIESTADADVLRGYDVRLVERVEWSPSVGGTEFALTCVECGNTVTNEGETERIDGTIYHFCCPSCHSRFRERYETFEEGAT